MTDDEGPGPQQLSTTSRLDRLEDLFLLQEGRRTSARTNTAALLTTCPPTTAASPQPVPVVSPEDLLAQARTDSTDSCRTVIASIDELEDHADEEGRYWVDFMHTATQLHGTSHGVASITMSSRYPSTLRAIHVRHPDLQVDAVIACGPDSLLLGDRITDWDDDDWLRTMLIGACLQGARTRDISVPCANLTKWHEVE